MKELKRRLSERQKKEVLKVLNNIEGINDSVGFLEDCEIITNSEKPCIYCSALAMNIKKYLEYIYIPVNRKLYKKIRFAMN